MTATPYRSVVAALTAGLMSFGSTLADAQESRLIPLFEVHRTDNAFGGSGAERITNGGVEIDAPDDFRAASDTVVGVGGLWLNAVQADVGGVQVSFSPFLRHRSYLNSGEHSTASGATMSFRLYDGPNDRVDLRATVARLDASWASDSVSDASVRLGYRRDLQGGAALNFGLSGGWQSLVTDGSVSQVGLDAGYQNTIGEFNLSATGRVTLRSSSVSGRSGRDLGLGLRLARQIGPGEAHTSFGVDWNEDRNARDGQTLARSETTTLAEIGYALPLDEAGLGQLTIYARRERSNANIALYDASTNVVGLGLRLGF